MESGDQEGADKVFGLHKNQVDIRTGEVADWTGKSA